MYNEMDNYLRAAFFGAIALTARASNHYKWSSNAIRKIITPLREINFFDVFTKKTRKHMESIEHNAPSLEKAYGKRFKALWGNFGQLYNILKKEKMLILKYFIIDQIITPFPWTIVLCHKTDKL